MAVLLKICISCLIFAFVAGHQSSRSRFIEYLLSYDAKVNTINDKYFNILSRRGVKNKRHLTCGFQGPCCWRNGLPTESQLSFQQVNGLRSKSMTNLYFGTRRTPDGTFAMVGAAHGEKPHFSAVLVSCPVVCAKEEVAVSFHFWRTPSVHLSVCVRNSSSDETPNELFGCKLVEEPNPGPTTQMMPSGQGFDIVISVNNFIREGDVAIVDNVRVDFETCIPVVPETTTTDTEPMFSVPPTTPAPCIPACRHVTCPFEGGEFCGGKVNPPDKKNAGSSKASPNLQVATGKFGNKVTGIPGPGEGEFYIAVELNNGEQSTLEVDVGDLSQAVVIKVLRFTATDGIQMIGCCDTLENCPLKTNTVVTVNDVIWKTSGFLCPKGTKKILFACKNNGQNIGSCGIDDIKLYYPYPQDPENIEEATTQIVCDEC